MNDIPRGRSVTVDMAHRFGMEPTNFEKVLRATVVPANCSPEQFAAFLLVAKQYSLNPITREIYAFPSRSGGIQPIVGIDGWMRIINDQDAFDGMEFLDHLVDGKLNAITCRIYRKDRTHPTAVTEYMDECQQDTNTWKRWPARMLRHKAAIQAARYAFGFSGIIDPDEYERGVSAGLTQQSNVPPPPPGHAPLPPESPLSTVISRGHNETSYSDPLRQSIKLTAEEAAVIDDEIPAEGGGDAVMRVEQPSPGEFVEVEAMDPVAYLNNLDDQMAVCQTDADLDEVWKEHEALEDTLFPPDRDKAQVIFDRHDRRIKATIAAESAPKRKK